MNHLVVSLMRQANTALSEMFDHYTTSEWIEQKVYPMFSKLSQIRNKADATKQIKYWPSRPYPPLQALTDMGIGLEQPKTSTTKKTNVFNPAQYSRHKQGGGSHQPGVYYSAEPLHSVPQSQKVSNSFKAQNSKNLNRFSEQKIGSGSSQYVRLSNHL